MPPKSQTTRTASQFAKDATDDADKASRATDYAKNERLYLFGRAAINVVAALALAVDRLAAALEKQPAH
ncbi:hypothetical protein ACWDV7_20785 [Streptomyces sp. NPDC003362]